MRIHWFFQAWTKDSTKPITLWVEANNQASARALVMKRNPFVIKLLYQRTKRID